MNARLLPSVKGTLWHKATEKMPCAADRAHVVKSGVCVSKNPIPTQTTLVVDCAVNEAHVLQRSFVWKGEYCILKEVLCAAKRAYVQ